MKILIFGDSLAHGLSHFPQEEYKVHIESFPGATTEELLGKENKCCGLSMMLAEDHYDVVVIVAGANDVGHGFAPDEVVKNLLQLGACRPHPISDLGPLLVGDNGGGCGGGGDRLVIIMSVPFAPKINHILSTMGGRKKIRK